MTLTTALFKFFGKKENHSLADFKVELNVLTQEDKIYFAELLQPVFKESITIDEKLNYGT